MRLCAPEATFLASFVRIGLSGVRRRRLVPAAARSSASACASELMMTGRAVAAEEAARIGLVNRVVPADELAGRGARARRGDRRQLAVRRLDDQEGARAATSMLRASRPPSSSAAPASSSASNSSASVRPWKPPPRKRQSSSIAWANRHPPWHRRPTSQRHQDPPAHAIFGGERGVIGGDAGESVRGGVWGVMRTIANGVGLPISLPSRPSYVPQNYENWFVCK